MPQITHVAKAQPRFATVPVLDPETGQPKRTPVMRNGVQKTTKRGALVFMNVTAPDKDNPLPPYTCDYCHKPIEVGTPYKHISPKSGPYGGQKKTRHEGCPTWNVWDYSSSLSAQLARIEHDFWNEIDGVETVDDVTSALSSAAEEIREIAEEKESGASNIEEGFGHETESSNTLRETAESLSSWADEIEAVDIPDVPEPEERWYIRGLDGAEVGDEAGYDTEEEAQAELDALIEAGERVEGDGAEVVSDTPDNPTDEELDGWRDEVRDACSIVGESPV
jgi:hypothetical protein